MSLELTSSPFDIQPPLREYSLNDSTLRTKLIDNSVDSEIDGFIEATEIGFLGGQENTSEVLKEEKRAGLRPLRLVGVFDGQQSEGTRPVGTIHSSVTGVTIPGGGVLPALAISDVTVAPTHHRRGIAKHLIAEQFSLAAKHDIPLLALTASEGGIYSRFGFSPATWEQEITVDLRAFRLKLLDSAGFGGQGRVRLVKPSELLESGPRVFEQSRQPGDVDRPDFWWRQALRFTQSRHFSHGDSGVTRAVVYEASSGTLEGYALYRVDEASEWESRRLLVDDFVAANAVAEVGLWKYLTEINLAQTLRFSAAPVQVPVRWLLADQRAVRSEGHRDGLWLRICDVRQALQARSYAADVTLDLQIVDNFGDQSGRYRLDAKAGGGSEVRLLDDGGDGGISSQIPTISLGIQELAALYLGGESIYALTHVGRVETTEPSGLDGFAQAFATRSVPFLRTHF